MRKGTRLVFTVLLQLLTLLRAEPVQYCRYGHGKGEIDFCMGVSNHHNVSMNDYDLYLSLTVTRSTALGWTAIGTGAVMDGSLMFIVYGDPHSGEGPVLSIRTVDGHHQPRLVTKGDMGEADLRVLQAIWVPSEQDQGTFVARIGLVCFACGRWPGAPLSAEASSQPWIWAWNDKQEMDVYAFDAHLKMHKHHSGNGGWGVFYVDMARSTSFMKNRPSLPYLRSGVTTLGTSDTPIGTAGIANWIQSRPAAHIHGFLMAVTIMIVFPLGTVAIRSKSGSSFQNHWMLQVVGLIMMAVGAVIGIVMSGKPPYQTTHQILGLVLSAILIVQGVLGWRHHVDFLRIQRRTWISHTHVWLGRAILVGGSINLVTGLVLANYSKIIMGPTAIVLALELLGLSLRAWNVARKASLPVALPQYAAWEAPAWKDKTESYFALAEEEEESGSISDDSGTSKKGSL